MQGTTEMTEFKLAYRRSPATTLDADEGISTLPLICSMPKKHDNAPACASRTNKWLTSDATIFDNATTWNTSLADRVWICSPIRRRTLCEKLVRCYFGHYKVLQRIIALVYEFGPDGIMQSQRHRSQPLVHVAHLKPALTDFLCCFVIFLYYVCFSLRVCSI